MTPAGTGRTGVAPYWQSADGKPLGRYRTIVADPPWAIDWHGGGKRRPGVRAGVVKRTLGYQTMPLEEIVSLPVPMLAEDAAGLFLWVTAPLNREGIGVQVARAWGFEPVGEFVWNKGMRISGHFPRSCHEMLLVCKRGDHRFASTPWVASVQTWTVSTQIHSRKPDAAMALIEESSPGPYLEMFARRRRHGWDAWGNEVPTAPVELPLLAAVRAEQADLFAAEAIS